MSATSARAPTGQSSDLSLYSTTVGKKAVMAVTGVILTGFVLVHMIGNLQMFAEPARMDAYAAFLKATPVLLWGTRIIVGLAARVHAFTALQLSFGRSFLHGPLYPLVSRHHATRLTSGHRDQQSAFSRRVPAILLRLPPDALSRSHRAPARTPPSCCRTPIRRPPGL